MRAVVVVAVYAVTQAEYHALLDDPPVEIAFHDVEPRIELGRELEVVGDVLVAITNVADAGQPVEVVTSSDLGVTWNEVQLPYRPTPRGAVSHFGLRRLDGGMLALGAARYEPGVLGGVPYLWVTEDGVEWRGGRVLLPAFASPDAGVGEVWRGPEGDLYMHLFDSGGTVVLRSGDAGATWGLTDCPERFGEEDGLCGPIQFAGELWVQADGDVSVDGGATWQEPELPGVDVNESAGFEVVQRADGGWLGTAGAYLDTQDGSDSWYQGTLFRSDDGLVWERVFDQDPRCAWAYPGDWLSRPVPLGRRWLVAYNCEPEADYAEQPAQSQLVVLDADGMDFARVRGTEERRHEYEQPVVVGDDVVVTMVQLEPTWTTGLRVVSPP